MQEDDATGIESRNIAAQNVPVGTKLFLPILVAGNGGVGLKAAFGRPEKPPMHLLYFPHDEARLVALPFSRLFLPTIHHTPYATEPIGERVMVKAEAGREKGHRIPTPAVARVDGGRIDDEQQFHLHPLFQ